MGKLLRRAARLSAAPLFSAHTLEEQRRLYDKHWNPKLFHGFLRLALSDFVFNRYLYRGHYAGGKDRRTVQEPAWEMVYREMTHRFTNTLVRKNFFLQMIFLGEVRYEEGLPPEAHPEVFQRAKDSTTEVRFTLGNFLELTQKNAYDFYSLSDTISYVADADAKTFVPKLHPEVPKGALILIRSFMRQPEIPVQSPWSIDREIAEDAKVQDCTGLYEFLALRR
jgi:S-adenosylmethionine-diacylglycerol 3-amino-3-carboxypropyl transferase